MELIESFKIDHTKLLRGIYVSRVDKFDDHICTTIDIRIKAPNKEPVIDMPALHTIEHLGASFLRNDDKANDQLIYFGPMGCRTGFYAIFSGEHTSMELMQVLTEMFVFIANFNGDIPGASAKECGNYLEHNLEMAKYEANIFLNEVLKVISRKNLEYPE